MGNPQHLVWLKEGVNSWNARRASQQFLPDFQSENISLALGGEERDFVHTSSRVNLTNPPKEWKIKGC